MYWLLLDLSNRVGNSGLVIRPLIKVLFSAVENKGWTDGVMPVEGGECIKTGSTVADLN